MNPAAPRRPHVSPEPEPFDGGRYACVSWAALAQAGAILVLQEFEDRANKIPFFSTIEYAKFRRPVVPGDTLMLEVTALRTGTKVQKMRGIATVNGETTAEAEILSIIAQRDKAV